MRKTNKKGFTIVELVIVIAVVAILAAVLVPTFVSVTKRANESKDTQLVRNLNTALAVDTEVGKHETMQSALEAAAKAGYDVAKINASATDNEILWDSKNDCFVYKKDSGIEYIPNSVSEEQQKAVKNYQYWIIASTPNATYSTYLYDYKGSGTETVTTGLDVGNETVAAITYKNDTANAQEVAIRTNGGTNVTVDADLDTVYHYGKAGSVEIIKCAMASYHVYAKITGTLTLKKGHVDIEKSGSIGIIDIKAVNASEFIISNKKGGALDIVKADNPEVITSENVKVSESTGVMTSEDKNAVAYSESKGFLKVWDKALGNGKTTLLADLEDKVYYVSVKTGITATFDLNGHKFKTDESGYSRVNGSLTMQDTSVNESGLYYCAVNYKGNKQDKGVLVVSGENASFTLESGTIEAKNAKGEFDSNNGQFGVAIWEGATTTINGGTIKAGWYTIVGNGNDIYATSNIIINGGKLISVCDYALYLPHNGVTKINDGIIDGAAGAISINRGSLIINGGSFSSDGTGETGDWGDGTGANETNALINSNAGYGDVTITVNGGNYNVAKLSVFAVGTKNNSNIAISSGTYNKYIDRWVVSGYSCVDNGDGTWTVKKAD